ncbi:MAG: UDP-N-acetylmuramate--L-alanine ligase [Burkholderia sp.]|nr:UDP-N-acetylmuramate--L-alanine ligase [Burkholderia sp.]
MKHIIKHVHLVGIGGSGMSGIAEVLISLGYEVSGSDILHSIVTERLSSLGARISIGHNALNIEGANAIVISTAVQSNNLEVLAAREKGLPIVHRALMLAEIMRSKLGIAIAGTHGKTTTTSLIVSVLTMSGLDPSFIIGGSMMNIGTNARLGTGDFIITEADESDLSFLNLSPVIAVITNIDADHMDTYNHDFFQLKQAFINFTKRLPFYGSAVVCVDDLNIRQIVPFISNPVICYGFANDAQVRAEDIEARDDRMHFTVRRKGRIPLQIILNLPGLHNVQNALAAVAVADNLNIADEIVQHALYKFNGVARRFQCYGELPSANGGFYTLIDDYGHHPTEIAATISAARGAFPGRRIILVFQPHRYTRTKDYFDDFVNVLSTIDVLILTEVYSAGEIPISAANGDALSRAIFLKRGVKLNFIKTIDGLPDALIKIARDRDVVITMGAGSISSIPMRLIQNRFRIKNGKCNNK